jgi:hypothetical protein
MGLVGDFIGAFKAGAKSGPTPPGTWRDMEKFGRFEGTGEVRAELTLPAGAVAVSVEDYLIVQELEAQLTGPSGEALELKHYSESPYDDDSKALKNLRRVVSARIEAPGIHQLTVKAPNGGEPLLIMVGEDATPGAALKGMAGDMVPGAKLWKRLRGS